MKTKWILQTYLLICICLSCKDIDVESAVSVYLQHEIITKRKDSCNTFEKVELHLKITNHSNDSLFLVMAKKDITPVDYVPYHENYQSYHQEVKSKVSWLESFMIDGYKKGTPADSFIVTVPVVTNRFQMDHYENKVDVFEMLSDLNKLYYSAELLCKENIYAVPVPLPETDKYNIQKRFPHFFEKIRSTVDTTANIHIVDLVQNDVVFVNPKETITLTYDIGYLYLIKATYTIKAIINESLNVKYLKGIKEIGGFKKFEMVIESDNLVIQSQ